MTSPGRGEDEQASLCVLPALRSQREERVGEGDLLLVDLSLVCRWGCIWQPV